MTTQKKSAKELKKEKKVAEIKKMAKRIINQYGSVFSRLSHE